MTEEKIRTLGQERAEYALDKVNVVLKKSFRDKFKPLSSSASSMILKNGFGQTLAFWLAKSKMEQGKHLELFNIVKDWLTDKKFVHIDGHDEKAFVMSISKMSQEKYLMAQNETIALLEWVKRYANAFIEDDKGDKRDD
mgnify:CR=1 FL=1